MIVPLGRTWVSPFLRFFSCSPLTYFLYLSTPRLRFLHPGGFYRDGAAACGDSSLPDPIPPRDIIPPGNMIPNRNNHSAGVYPERSRRNAENRLTAVDGGSTASYVYDALGHREQKTVGSTPTNYVYDLSGNVVAEVNNTCGSICWAVFYAYMNGQLVAEYKNLTTYFIHSDHLGSTRLVTGIGSSQVPNGSFEQGLTGWSASNSTLITDPARAHSGNNYVQVSAPTGGQGIVMMSPELAVQVGDQLSFGGWSYLESGGGGPLGWWLQVEDSNHNALSWINASPAPTTSSGWTFQSATYTVPSGIAYVALYSTIYLPTASSVLRADDGFLYDSRLSTTIVQNLDYLPFGELNSTDSGISTHKFTGDERDAETSLDHTQFRQYTSQLARWISPDPAGLAAVDPANPQSWNRYAYVGNDPMDWIDPSGLGGICAHLYDAVCPIGGGGVANDPFGGSGSGSGVVVIWLPGGSVQASVESTNPTLDPEGNATSGSVDASSGPIMSFNGEWITFTQIESSSNGGGNSSSTGTFVKTFINGVLHGDRQPGESFAACVDRNIKETTLGKVDPAKLLNPALVKAEATAFALAITEVPLGVGGGYSINGLQAAAAGLGGLAARLAGTASVARPVLAVAKGGGYALAVAGAATAGLVIGSAINCR
jgi:RHS repeat-associated protein